MTDGEWEKVLWKTQPFPDNYIPPHAFLSSLRKNPNFRPYTYWPLVLGSCAIAQHLNSIFIFLAVFVRLNERAFDPRILIWISIVCFVCGYVLWELLESEPIDKARRRLNRNTRLKSSILIFLAIIAVSPFLRTIAASTSSDSIWAISACTFILNTTLADFTTVRVIQRKRESLPSMLSIYAAMFATTALASRLSDDLAVFGLILFAVQTFAMFPLLRHRLQLLSAVAQACITIGLSALSVTLTLPLSVIISYIYAASLLSVIFVAPAMLLWAQRYKNEIRGPWDVAVPKVN